MRLSATFGPIQMVPRSPSKKSIYFVSSVVICFEDRTCNVAPGSSAKKLPTPDALIVTKTANETLVTLQFSHVGISVMGQSPITRVIRTFRLRTIDAVEIRA
jgi:hypothetical protein